MDVIHGGLGNLCTFFYFNESSSLDNFTIFL